MTKAVRLEYDGPVAVITNDNAEKHNAFDDDMDQQLFDILGELAGRPDVRAVIWRGEGKSFSSGRDVSAIGGEQVELTHHELMSRGHRGILQLFDIEAPIIVAMQGWSIGASFQRALLCDIRVAAEGARFMLPEVTHGVIPDTGGVGAAVPDLRPRRRDRHGAHRSADGGRRGLAHGIVSRVVPPDELDATVTRDGARRSRPRPAVTVKMARRVHRATWRRPSIRSSMADELIYQTFISQVRRHGRVPRRPRRGPRPALHRELRPMTTERADRPARTRPRSARPRCPPARSTASRCSSPAAAPVSGKAIALEFARPRRVDRDRQPQARAPRGRPRGA